MDNVPSDIITTPIVDLTCWTLDEVMADGDEALGRALARLHRESLRTTEPTFGFQSAL